MNELQEYVLNNAAAWNFPNIAGEADEARNAAVRNWEQYITVFDTAILSLFGDQEMNADEIAAHLDESYNLPFGSAAWNGEMPMSKNR